MRKYKVTYVTPFDNKPQETEFWVSKDDLSEEEAEKAIRDHAIKMTMLVTAIEKVDLES